MARSPLASFKYRVAARDLDDLLVGLRREGAQIGSRALLIPSQRSKHVWVELDVTYPRGRRAFGTLVARLKREHRCPEV